MQVEIIKPYFDHFYNLTTIGWKHFADCFTEVHYPAGKIVLEQGKVCHSLGLIYKGVARNFFLGNGKEITNWFDSEGSFIGSMYSFLAQKPSEESIELLEPSILYMITYKDYQKAKKAAPEIDLLEKKITFFYINLIENRTRNLLAYSAVERYHLFFKQHPDLLNRVPLKIIASFLGITPETLSRIRANNY
jgi:CRP/FNR family transcriptional regulator, anaerobic regulatory protein